MPTSNSILIVDDEKPILDTYQFYLGMAASNVEIGPQQPAVIRSSRSSRLAKADPGRASEYRILVACTGESAVEIVEKEKEEGRRIAAAFFDMKMPGGIDGIETIRRIRLIDADILCTVVTAYQDSSIDDINQLFLPNHEDHWDYLNKPFTEAEIRQKARNMVSSWRGRRREEAQRRKLDVAASENRRLYCDLKALNADLEERVVARTFDLDRANTTLRSKTDELEVLVASLQETKHKLGHQERLAVVGRLAATVAHEIKQPLCLCIGELARIIGTGRTERLRGRGRAREH
ncbi:MAG: response regulator [Kofleriaceae bacterium]|nr:response regulator [Kofleriaceae bacterium]